VLAVPSLCQLYPGICLTTEEKARKTVRVTEEITRVAEEMSQGRKFSKVIIIHHQHKYLLRICDELHG
jgi:hypothetical protein